MKIQFSGHGTVLHLSELDGDGTPGSVVFFRVTDLDACAAAPATKGSRYQRPAVEELPWGRQLSLTDPFGNHLRICQQDS
jgi:predicted enzyme related to lactoylglutathione lyase